MASLEEAFQKFLKWKKLNTFLRVSGMAPDQHSCLVTNLLVSVASVDPGSGLIGLIREERPHDILPLDLGDANFNLSEDQKVLEVRSRAGERWLFKEQPPL
jgi:hypothetical protein